MADPMTAEERARIALDSTRAIALANQSTYHDAQIMSVAEAIKAAYERGRAAENEACALVADELDEHNLPPTERMVADAISYRIRARLAPS